MSKKILLSAICLISSAFSSTALLAESLVVVPDAMAIDEVFEQPLISISESDSEIRAQLSFRTSWQQSLEILQHRFGDEFVDLDIYQVNILPLSVNFYSDFFGLANPAFKTIEIVRDTNFIRVTLIFDKRYSIEDIRAAVSFPISLGTIDAQIECSGDVVFSGCGKRVNRIPLINKYSAGVDAATLDVFYDYVYLRSYASRLVVTQFPYLSEEFAKFVKDIYWANGDCGAANRVWDQDACIIATKYASTPSIREAVLVLAEEIFDDVMLTNVDFYIFEGSELYLSYLGKKVDVEDIESALQDAAFPASSVDVDLDISLVTDASIHMDGIVDVQPDSLFMQSGSVVLLTDQHIRATADIGFTFIFSRYTIPVSFDVRLGFRYEIIDKQATVDVVGVTNLQFLATDGIGYDLVAPFTQEIEIALNGYLGQAQSRAEVAEELEDILATYFAEAP